MSKYKILEQSILAYFLQWERNTPDAVFLRMPQGNSWIEMTFQEVGLASRKLVSYMHSIGLIKGDHIAIISKNCPEWIIADLAIMMGGMVSGPFFANIPADQLGELLIQSDSKALFIGKLDEWASLKKGIPDGIQLIKMKHYEGNAKVDLGRDWDEIMKIIAPVDEICHPSLDDLWTIIYTSGTTGLSKGAIIQHGTPIKIIVNEGEHADIKIFEFANHRYVSYLPLNHIAERIIVEVAAIVSGAPISFIESVQSFTDNIQSIRPTVFLAVPRIWMKFQQGILQKMSANTLKILLKLPLISSLIKRKIKIALGLSEAKVILTGAAYCSDEIKNWFWELDIRIHEVYGMTENCGGCALMPFGERKDGFVGKLLPKVEVKIDASSGEIIMRAPWLMKGYYKNEEMTRSVLKEGWLYTGDSGELENNYLKITGRISDTFKTSKGKFVVPSVAEKCIASHILVEQACVIGNGLEQPMAIIVLTELAKEKPESELEQIFRDLLIQTNSVLPNHEKLARLVLEREPWTNENNMLTPTLKVKRREVDKKYLSLKFEENKDVIFF
ncbi:MAG: AMP-binding protein [Bacteroidetes bacterium]|nr:AMP-binding protein [Bacteroidota bacterium]